MYFIMCERPRKQTLKATFPKLQQSLLPALLALQKDPLYSGPSKQQGAILSPAPTILSYLFS